ncbi:YbjN domain-containing protein [Erythrobacter sp. NFXS35]|uniref:hypothetical protein n=1 Tax=Erythrobacter sp. NFXS35 TaxID=2818436 RepID=UPI0032DEEFA9
MRFVSIIAAGALALAAAAPASAQTYISGDVKASVGTADLAAVVGSLGHQVIEQEEGVGEDGEVMILAESPDQIRYVLLGTACDVEGVPGCQGVLMQAQFDLPPGATYASVADANLNFAALNIWVDFEQKSLGFTRYVVLDQGVTMANLRANVEVLLSLTGEAYPVAAGEAENAQPPSV